MNRFTIINKEAVGNLNLHNKLVLNSQLVLGNGKLGLTPNNNMSFKNLDTIFKDLLDYSQRCETYLKSYIVDTVLKLPKNMKYTRPLGCIVEINSQADLDKLEVYKDTAYRYNMWLVIVTNFMPNNTAEKEIVNA